MEGRKNVWKFDLREVKRDIMVAFGRCNERGLIKSAKWLAELNFALKDVKAAPAEEQSLDASELDPEVEFESESDRYILAKSYFDVKEYDRCAHFTESCKHPKTRFLHLYSRYLAGEKKRLDDMTDTLPIDNFKASYLKDLRMELERGYTSGTLDGYLLYLYGVVLKQLDLETQAMDILLESIHAEPSMWGAWLELAGLIADRSALSALSLPEHWIKSFFLGHTYLEHQMNEEALQIYWTLQGSGLQDSTYVMAQSAIAYHNKRDIDRAIEAFRGLQESDPYRLDNMDIYSNLLYVKELRVDLSVLAHKTCQIDKYRVETCCVVGNYYSLRSEHQKAVLYFQRALRLNPNYLSAWTLMGHEFMEMKNTNAAIQSYRQAIEVNRRDYRAWYGLGQTYEIIKMPYYCLYYYKQAQCLRPNDSRMLIALGEAYEKLDRIPDALKCYSKAHCVGDIEGVALLRLAKLYERLGQSEQAAATYDQYVQETEAQGIVERDEQSQAYKFLANFFLRKGRLDRAYHHAQKCLECADTKEEGKALLKTIALRRSQQEDGSMLVEDDGDKTEEDSTATAARIVPMALSFTP